MIFNIYKHKALDDVILNDGECGHIGDCDFEKSDACEWESLISNSITTDWTVTSGNANYGTLKI
jgi:hypothetical protein